MKKTKVNKYYLSLAGEYRVASELLKRNLNATVTFGNAKSTDVIAYGSNRKARIIEVKTSQQKNFVTGFYNKYRTAEDEHPDFWCLFGRPEKNRNFLGGVGPLERVPIIPGHPALRV